MTKNQQSVKCGDSINKIPDAQVHLRSVIPGFLGMGTRQSIKLEPSDLAAVSCRLPWLVSFPCIPLYNSPRGVRHIASASENNRITQCVPD